jgi:hypothetical protein
MFAGCEGLRNRSDLSLCLFFQPINITLVEPPNSRFLFWQSRTTLAKKHSVKTEHVDHAHHTCTCPNPQFLRSPDWQPRTEGGDQVEATVVFAAAGSRLAGSARGCDVDEPRSDASDSSSSDSDVDCGGADRYSGSDGESSGGGGGAVSRASAPPPHHVNVVDCGDGSYTCTWTPTTAVGMCSLEVRINGVHIQASP